MSLPDILAQLQPDAKSPLPAKRLYAELHFASCISEVQENKYDGLLAKAMDLALQAMQQDGTITNATVLACEKLLAPLSKVCKAYTAHCVGHAHIDMNWMWGYNETAAITVDTFRTVLDLMKEYPKFTFSQSQASTYQIIEENAPEMLEEIKQRIREGRWEVTASTWVENDKNMPSAESLARQILYTKRYLAKLLDLDPNSLQLDFEPDTFGHNVSVPEICAQGGVKYYYHCRGREASETPSAYIWQSRSGKELLVWNEPHWYNLTSASEDLFWDYPFTCHDIHSRDFLVVYGVGDHGGGPTRKDLDCFLKMDQWPLMPRIQFSTYHAFFQTLEKVRKYLPHYTGEINCIFTGCYTSQSRIKMANHLGEDRLYESECLAAEANLLANLPKRNALCKSAWECILFNQFHDILPGSCVQDTREYAMGRFQKAMGIIQTNANIAMRALAEAIDTSDISEEVAEGALSEGAGVGFGLNAPAHYALQVAERGLGKKRIFHIFNTTQIPYDGVCDLTIWDWNYAPALACFTDEKGEEVPHQLVQNDTNYWRHAYKKFALQVKVPAFGYATCILDTRSRSHLTRPLPPSPRRETYNDGALTLENDRLLAVFDHASMQLIQLTDKVSKKQLIAKSSAHFLFIQENSTVRRMSSWRVGDRMLVQNLNESQPVTTFDKQDGPLRQSLKYELPFGTRSKLTAVISLTQGSNCLEYEVSVDFHEVGILGKQTPLLCFEVPFGYSATAYRYDVPLGTIDRVPAAQDVPANSFALALSDTKDSSEVMLISDCKYGFRGWDNTLAVSLIRASTEPDLYPEYGMHHFRLGLACLARGENPLNVKEKFLHPLVVCTARKGKGSLPLTGQFLKFTGDARITAVKTSEDTNGIIIRLAEATGQESSFSLELPRRIRQAKEVDINENPIRTLTAKGKTLQGVLAPYALMTLLIEL